MDTKRDVTFLKPPTALGAIAKYFLENYPEQIKEELITARQYQPVDKDIIILVHDQLDCTRDCINSIVRNTQNYHIYIWDNGSKEETANYLQSVKNTNISVERCEENLGFIIPNNRLAARGKSPYIILLNSDTIVRKGWDETMIAWLQTHPDIASVGCQGGLLDERMIGKTIMPGYDIDYLCGWCLCFPRSIYERVGLFDENHLDFAYGEDSDFSFRLKDAGYKIYGMHSDLVLHLQARTSMTVQYERDMSATFIRNHAYLVERWGKCRISLREQA